jgi:hypothetical protein
MGLDRFSWVPLCSDGFRPVPGQDGKGRGGEHELLWYLVGCGQGGRPHTSPPHQAEWRARSERGGEGRGSIGTIG